MSSRRETEYRGYRIEMERRDLCWTVSVSPTRPELPILSILVSDHYPVRKSGLGSSTTAR